VQLNLLVLSYIASAAVSGAVAVVAWRRRQMAGARELALLMLASGWWLLANAFEASALGLSAKVAWSVVAYVGIESAPVLYLLFVLGWTRQDRWLTRPRIALLLLVPFVSVGMAVTNESHHLLWPTVTLIDAWGVTAVYAHGPWFWVEVAYAYGLVGAALVALIAAIARYPAVYATRLRLLIVGSLAPLVGSVLYAAGLDSFLHADLSSIAFAIGGLIGAWVVLRLRLLDVVPVAWPTVVDALADAVLVLDSERRIAAVNLSATRLLGHTGDAIGQTIDQQLRQLPELLATFDGTGDQEVEIALVPPQSGRSGFEQTPTSPQTARWYNVRLTTIGDERGRDAGFLVVLRDITERRQMVDTIRRLSLTDELTGLLNRRGFTNLADQQLRTSLRTGNRLWLLFADVDSLKDINDRMGHEAGDRALSEIAQMLRTGSFREGDLVARLGGDEFAILATEVSRTDGDTLVRRIQDALGKANEAPDREFVLSLSVGVAMFDPHQPQTLGELIDEADRRMYEAKHDRTRQGLPPPQMDGDPYALSRALDEIRGDR
jgi:diguanylate cyclase (GGDEF)-like protein/PAS domain S-box-containing protein